MWVEELWSLLNTTAAAVEDPCQLVIEHDSGPQLTFQCIPIPMPNSMQRTEMYPANPCTSLVALSSRIAIYIGFQIPHIVWIADYSECRGGCPRYILLTGSEHSSMSIQETIFCLLQHLLPGGSVPVTVRNCLSTGIPPNPPDIGWNESWRVFHVMYPSHTTEHKQALPSVVFLEWESTWKHSGMYN